MDSIESNADSSSSRLDALVARCIERIEAHFENEIDALVETYPELERAIDEEVEALRAGGPEPGAGHGWNRESRRAGSGPGEGLEPIGSYQPLEEIGRGGQGIVYLAEDRRLGRVVALKVLKGFGPLSEKLIQRFRREAEVASKLDHPGICTVYEADVVAGVPYIAMRLVPGSTLARRISEARMAASCGAGAVSMFVDLEDDPGPEVRDAEPESSSSGTAATRRDDVMQVVAIIEKSACAIHAAHEAGIIHRDVKPGNIMVSPTGEPVLLDFGLASEEANEISLTRSGDFFGTPAYMSPEQLGSRHVVVDRRTDVFSLAVTLFECVTLRRPFDAPTREAMYQAILAKNPPPVRKLNPRVPRDLAVVIEKALEKDPDQRYPTALAFAEDLERVRHARPIAARPVGALGRAVRWARRRPARAALAAALIVGIPMVTLLAGYAWAKQPQIAAARERAALAAVERHLEAGFAELAHGDPATALASFDAALAGKPHSGAAIGGKALALVRLARQESCLWFLDGARSRRPDVEAVFDRLRVDALRALGRERKADELEEAIPAAPRSALSHFLAGVGLLRDCRAGPDPDRFRTAVRHLENAVLASPHARPVFHFALAHAAGHLGENGPSEDAARALRLLWPDSAAANRWAEFALDGVRAAAVAEPETSK